MSLVFCRRLGSSATWRNAITNFSARKQGTGAGPFVEFPDVQPLHDSVLLRIPSFSSVVSKLDNVTVIDASNELKDVDLTKLFSIRKQANSDFVTLSTGDEPVNAIFAASSRLNNVTVINIDDYEKGWTINDPLNNVLCYSGDVSMDGNKLSGRGMVAITGHGPSWHLQLKASEKITVTAFSVLGYSAAVSVTPVKIRKALFGLPFTIPSLFTLPSSMSSWIRANLSPRYDSVRVLFNRLLQKEKIMAEIEGPGHVILQQFTPSVSRNFLYTNEAIKEAIKR